MRRILATSIAAAIPVLLLPAYAVDAYAKPAPPPLAGSHSRSGQLRSHSAHGRRASHRHYSYAPVGEPRNRSGRPVNDVKVDASDEGARPEAPGAPTAGIGAHGAPGAPTTHAGRTRPVRPTRGRPATRPGTGADTGFADADEQALPPEATAALQEAADLQELTNTPHNATPNATTPGTTTPAAPIPGSAVPGRETPSGAPGVTAPGATMPDLTRPARTIPGRQLPGRRAPARQAPVRGPGRMGAAAMPAALFGNAGPVGAYGSTLVLHTTTGSAPEHTVTLQCYPPGGTHPRAAAACAELARARGDLAQLPVQRAPHACFMIYSPVTASARGAWQGRPVRYTKKFPNSCVLRDKTGSVFDF